MALTTVDANGYRGPMVAWPDGRPLWKQRAKLVAAMEFLRAEWSYMVSQESKRSAAGTAPGHRKRK